MESFFSHQPNPRRLTPHTEAAAAVCMRNLSDWRPAVDEIRTWPEYSPQPLHTLPGLARKCGVAELLVKDESRRFGREGEGLGSFKALGAPYAVYRILADEVATITGGRRPTSAELRASAAAAAQSSNDEDDGKMTTDGGGDDDDDHPPTTPTTTTKDYSRITQRVTVCVATDGNQGRGLAYGAKIFGCRCVVYIHQHVSPGRARAIEDLGATVVRVDGEYEASVARARGDAAANEKWFFVSSTSWGDFGDGGGGGGAQGVVKGDGDGRKGKEDEEGKCSSPPRKKIDVARHVMGAYMTLVDETLDAMANNDGGRSPYMDSGGDDDDEKRGKGGKGKRDEIITHVVVCGGVGSIAAAIFQGFYEELVVRLQQISSSAESSDDGSHDYSAAAAAANLLPRFIVVEPHEADCLYQSARKGTGEPIRSEGTLRTLMAGLACRQPSPAAWKMLDWLASDFVAVPDSVAVDGMRALAVEGGEEDVPVVIGESSGAAMGFLLGSARDPVLREKSGLDGGSRVLIFGLEGATDPDIYESLVGKAAGAVFAAQDQFLAKRR